MTDPAPEPLWEPSPERIERAAMTRFAREHGLPGDYESLWRWSVEDIRRFWRAIWDYFEVGEGDPGPVLTDDSMPGAVWFPEARGQLRAPRLPQPRPEEIAIRRASESRALAEVSWGELREPRASAPGCGPRGR